MAKITWKSGTMLAPLPPALISCGTMDKPNVMTAAWTGIVCTEPTLTYVSIRPSRYSNQLIRETGEFVINVPTVKLAKAVDLCGVKSGRQVDKFALSKITPAACDKISAPQVLEAPVSLECKVKEITSYGTHDVFLAEVVAVDIDDAYLTDAQALDLSKAGLLAYAHGFYYALGKQIGKFGWSVEKKSTKKKRAARLQAEKSGKVQKAKSQTLRLKKTAVKRKKAGEYGRK
ncbi:MAG: flavin reductase family protein [Alphaproteobacteria bacterium]